MPELLDGLVAGGLVERDGLRLGDARLQNEHVHPEVTGGLLQLLEDHGLEASYLSAHLQARPVAEQPQAPAVRSAEERLRELRSLLEPGLISQEEHDARRRAVVDAL